jgi:hypothetical protein
LRRALIHIRILAERAADFTLAGVFVASRVWIVGETGLSFALVIPTWPSANTRSHQRVSRPEGPCVLVTECKHRVTLLPALFCFE